MDSNPARFPMADGASVTKGGRNDRKPGGPNKVTAELHDLAGQYAETALAALASVARDEEAPAAARVAAGSAIIRACVKPKQAPEPTPQFNHEEFLRSFDAIDRRMGNVKWET
jgi:hypothetical protein